MLRRRPFRKSAIFVLAVLISAPPAAAQRVIVNPSFESNDPQGPGAPNYEIYSNGAVPGWDSASGEIELWDSTFNGVPAYAGSVFAEMNANVPGAFYQNICMVNGEAIGWTFAHRARSGGPATQTARFQVANMSGALIQNLATQASTINNIWNVNSGSATYTGASGVQRVQFITTDPGSFGNFLDDIRITLNPFVELSTASAAGVESLATANLPTLTVNGTLFTARTVNVSISGGTAVLGNDYTTPGGGASFSVTIPAGTYQNAAVPLGIQIIDDASTEGSETIQIALNSGTGYTVSSTSGCGGAARTASIYTITDNDSPVVLAKNWVTGIAGDAVSLAISGGSGPTAGSSIAGGAAPDCRARYQPAESPSVPVQISSMTSNGGSFRLWPAEDGPAPRPRGDSFSYRFCIPASHQVHALFDWIPPVATRCPVVCGRRKTPSLRMRPRDERQSLHPAHLADDLPFLRRHRLHRQP